MVLFLFIAVAGCHIIKENGLADTTDNETNDDDDSEATAPTQPPQQTPDPNAGGEGADEGNVATTPPDPEKEKETPEKEDEEGNKDGEPAGTTPAPVKGAPPQYNINLVPVQESGSGCFGAFTNAYLKAKDVKTRNAAFQDLRICLTPKCDIKACNKEKRKCEAKKKSLTPTDKYECWYYWYECISDTCEVEL